MIKEIKDIVVMALKDIGIPERGIARTAKDAVNLNASGLDTYATVITAIGRYGDPMRAEAFVEIDGKKTYIKVRIRRRLPLIVKIVGRTEDDVDALFSQFIKTLPFKFMLEGREGSIEPGQEEHSDYDAAMDERYESVLRVDFNVDVGPSLESTPLGVSSMKGDLENGQSE